MCENENTRLCGRRSERSKDQCGKGTIFSLQFVRGSLSELIELSQKCCVNINEKMNDECPFVSKSTESARQQSDLTFCSSRKKIDLNASR